MSQFDFGNIDPYVVDGVQLAGMLNQWRDAIHSMHRGASRPSYAVPGILWINDSGGASSWIVNVYLGAVGDRPLFTYDTTTGNITWSASASGTLSAAILLASTTTLPSVRWSSTSNPIDQKNWRSTVMNDGTLRFSAYNDAGTETAWIQFGRDGTLTSSAGSAVVGWRSLGSVNVSSAVASVDIVNWPTDVNHVMCFFDLVPVTNDVSCILQFYNASGTIDNTTGHYGWSNAVVSHGAAVNSAPSASSSTSAAYTAGILLNYSGGTNTNVYNNAASGGISGEFIVANVRNASRVKNVNYRSQYTNGGNSGLNNVNGGGQRSGAAGLITGMRLLFGSGNIAGGLTELWGSP